MSEPLYRVALIGCGNIAFGFNASLQRPGIHTHASAIKASLRLQVVAVCDADPAAARACADFCETNAIYSNTRELLERESVDVIAICTPDATHAEIAVDVLDSVKGLMIEKPLALTVADAEKVAQKAKGIPVAVNYNRRYAGLRELAAQVGTIKSLSGYYTKGVSHNGSHWFDLADFFTGPLAHTFAQDAVKSGSADPTLDVLIEFANGACGFLKGCAEQDYTIFEMDILGDQGRLRLTDSGHKAEIWKATDSPTRQGYRELIPQETITTGLSHALPALWDDLVKCLDEGKTPISSVENAMRAIRAVEAATEAARSGKRIAV